MEELLHYVWKHKIHPLEPLATTDGRRVEVLDAGLKNPHAGPDFFNAKLRIGETVWVGNVEVHSLASDWLRHGHQHDEAYNNVILHVVEQADTEVSCANGRAVPQLVLPIPQQVSTRYEELLHTDRFPPCYRVVPRLHSLTIHSWLSALQVERLEQKTRAIAARLQQTGNHWEDVFFITLSRNFGFGVNGDAFEWWATHLPFRAVDKHRDNLFQVEAIFLGTAGLLEEQLDHADAYYEKLQREFSYLKHKFDLPHSTPCPPWRLLRLRPGNFPHLRLAQLASLYHREQALFSRAMEATRIDDLSALFRIAPSPYWEAHYRFATTSPRIGKQLSQNSINLIIINTVVPFLYAYGQHKGNETLCERATQFLESLKPEANYVTRMWQAAGLQAENAADSQALVQLQTAYCDKKECLRCRFGYEYLR